MSDATLLTSQTVSLLVEHLPRLESLSTSRSESKAIASVLRSRSPPCSRTIHDKSMIILIMTITLMMTKHDNLDNYLRGCWSHLEPPILAGAGSVFFLSGSYSYSYSTVNILFLRDPNYKYNYDDDYDQCGESVSF